MALNTIILVTILFLQYTSSSSFYDNPDQDSFPHQQQLASPQDPLNWSQEELEAKWGLDWSFSGISTFAHLPHIRCLTHPEERFDIGIIGAPFDTAVSYRPGARFGPRAIRAASARQNPLRSYNQRAGLNPYTQGLRVLDCGDIPITAFDNALALRQMTAAYTQLASRSTSTSTSKLPSFRYPKLITLGGDHSIALAALRALHTLYKTSITVIHFDAHLDTWHPTKYPAAWPSSDQSAFNHGSMFHLAHKEGLLSNRSVHAGLRTRLSDLSDYTDDTSQGWLRISADEIDDLKPQGVIDKIIARVTSSSSSSSSAGSSAPNTHSNPVYLSFDIDVIDPGLAPGTGTPEPGGWTSREVIRILRGLEGVELVGADVVEVAPAYDGVGEQTGLVAAQVVFEVLSSMVKFAVAAAGAGAGEEVEVEVESEGGKDEL